MQTGGSISICAWSAIGTVLDKGLLSLSDFWLDVGLARCFVV